MEATPNSLSPGPGNNDGGLLVCSTTDIQDSKSSHSDHQHYQQQHSPIVSSQLNLQQQQQQTHHRRSPKTEYKSNFTPFDQYVYNEITDSFVTKQHQQQQPLKNNSANLMVESTRNHPLSASSSNQDLLASSEATSQSIAVSPALEAGVFEPVNGSDANQRHDVTSEPWYMEVMKRNEKANEYRFKSELGHSSPLLKNGNSKSHAENAIRNSPLGNDPLTDAQIQDHQQSAAKFSPHDYKRDHMISHMANNNNFKLQKEPDVASRVASRRVPTTASASKPLTRTTAASRARSQSSRRPVSTTNTTASSNKAEPTSKSNQTTPTRSVPLRSAAPTTKPTPRPPTSTTRTTTPAVRPTPTSSSTRPTTNVTRRLLTATTKVAPARPTTNAPHTNARTTSVASSTRTTGPRSQNPVQARTVSRPTSTTQPTKSPIKRTSNVSSIAPGHTASTTSAASTRPTSTRFSASRKSSTPTVDVSPSSNAVKSIKTKALVDAGEKAAAAAAVASVVSENNSNPTLETTSKEIETPTKVQEDLQQAISQDTTFDDSHQLVNYLSPEPNLIFTTTEGGNMLADEIAQAEKAANETVMKEQVEGKVHVEQQQTDVLTDSPVELEHRVDVIPENVEDLKQDSSASVNNSNDLVNGLEGGLVSAEDRYDSSEREASFDYATTNQQNSQSMESQSQNNDDEPYSIMPTTFDVDEAQKQTEEKQNEVINEARVESNSALDAKNTQTTDEDPSEDVQHLSVEVASPDLSDSKDEFLNSDSSTKIEPTDNTQQQSVVAVATDIVSDLMPSDESPKLPDYEGVQDTEEVKNSVSQLISSTEVNDKALSDSDYVHISNETDDEDISAKTFEIEETNDEQHVKRDLTDSSDRIDATTALTNDEEKFTQEQLVEVIEAPHDDMRGEEMDCNEKTLFDNDFDAKCSENEDIPAITEAIDTQGSDTDVTNDLKNDLMENEYYDTPHRMEHGDDVKVVEQSASEAILLGDQEHVTNDGIMKALREGDLETNSSENQYIPVKTDDEATELITAKFSHDTRLSPESFDMETVELEGANEEQSSNEEIAPKDDFSENEKPKALSMAEEKSIEVETTQDLGNVQTSIDLTETLRIHDQGSRIDDLDNQSSRDQNDPDLSDEEARSLHEEDQQVAKVNAINEHSIVQANDGSRPDSPLIESAVVESKQENDLLMDDQDTLAPKTEESTDDSRSTSIEEINKNELLMNVADLVTIESIKKQEMSKKSELAREQSSSLASLSEKQTDGILLSADQLNEQLLQLSGVKPDLDVDLNQEQHTSGGDNNNSQVKLEKFITNETPEVYRNIEVDGGSKVTLDPDPIKLAEKRDSVQKAMESSDNLLDFGSMTPTNDGTETDPGRLDVREESIE